MSAENPSPIDTVEIRHEATGGTSIVTEKAFYGTYRAKGWALADAPPDADLSAPPVGDPAETNPVTDGTDPQENQP